MIRILIAIMFLMSCGGMDRSAEYRISAGIADKDLNTILKRYRKDKIRYLGYDTSYYSIRFKIVDIMYDSNGDKKSGMIRGSCRYNDSPINSVNSRVVSLKKSYWNDSLYREKLLVVYHELGHCDLNLKHINGTIMQHDTGPLIDADTDKLIADFFNLTNQITTETEHKE